MRYVARLFAWAGGAIFVTSLAVCAGCYLIVWGRPVPHATSSAAIAVNALLLTMFAAHHSLFAREPAKALIARTVPPDLVRCCYVWIASALLIVACLGWRSVGGEIWRLAGVAAVASAAIQLTGIALIAFAVRYLDPLELAGIRPPSAREPLQATGVYGLVRHPLYLGWILCVFGTAHLTGDRLAFAIITTAYLVVAVPWEEQSLRRSFGQDYDRYVRTVRWRIVPFIY
jgi:protein-S-isoprenylcysteine O-methyltransferase Ste14